ncbi:DUF1285 domain-containing protein, partial [Gammaproteobacteria bacterium]|nr:DUF1285 domain-containing protein [Gammaproteobacteria bacterium]
PSSKELIFHTNFDFSFPLNNGHPLIIKNINNEDYPIVEVRSGIEGLISRSVYYKLIDIAISQQTSAENETLTIQSFDSHHSLGSLA